MQDQISQWKNRCSLNEHEQKLKSWMEKFDLKRR